MPRSRAKDHVIRDAVARKPMTTHIRRAMIRLAIAVVPAFDPMP